MTPEMMLTMVVLAFAVWLFVSEWIRVDVVGVLMMVLLPLMGLIAPKQAFVGLTASGLSDTYLCPSCVEARKATDAAQ